MPPDTVDGAEPVPADAMEPVVLPEVALPLWLSALKVELGGLLPEETLPQAVWFV